MTFSCARFDFKSESSALSSAYRNKLTMLANNSNRNQ